MSQKPFFVTIPHSGEKIPAQTPWLKTLPEVVLMRDVDRFVDQLYLPIIESLKIPFVKTEWHRYAVDLNRLPQDIDKNSVLDAPLASGHERGFHWTRTTLNETLSSDPMPPSTHKELKELIYDPFHKKVESLYGELRQATSHKTIYHLDLHSMPSLGTQMHLDPGELRADIVISDCQQKSANSQFRDLTLAAYAVAGFKVAYNWPYRGGRLSEQYGKPSIGQQSLQVELNRKLYMNEDTKKMLSDAEKVKIKLGIAIKYIYDHIPL